MPTLERFSLDRQRQLKRRFSQAKRRVDPTILVEYAAGPRWTYAIAWSVKRRGETIPGETIQEGPFLVRIAPSQAFYEASDRQVDPDLGQLIFGRIFDLLTTAVEAESGSSFEKQLGVAVAHDKRVALADLANVRFQRHRSHLEPANLFSQLVDADIEWQTLSELRANDWACDYVLLAALSDSQAFFQAATPAKVWALATLDKAVSESTSDGDGD